MKIAPSILDANWQQLQTEIDSIASCDRIHLDIMDGHYVPNLSFGASMINGINFPTETEVHLMVNNPESFFPMFLDMGVNGITFHIENTGRSEAVKLLKQLKESGVRAGVCVDGYTSIDFLDDEILKVADQILLMSVKAGFGGQAFMPTVLEKIKLLRSRGYLGEIEIDGGVNLDNVTAIKDAGADIVVVGSFLMKKPIKDRTVLISSFQKI